MCSQSGLLLPLYSVQGRASGAVVRDAGGSWLSLNDGFVGCVVGAREMVCGCGYEILLVA